MILKGLRPLIFSVKFMDIFGSSKETLAASVTTKILGDFDDPLPGIITGAILTGEELLPNLLDYQTKGYFSRAEKYYKYGRDTYIRGLPKGTHQQRNIDYQNIRRILQDSTGERVIIRYAVVNTDYINHYVMQYLQDVREIDPVTKIIGIDPPGAISDGWLIYDEYTVAVDKLSADIKYNYNIFGSFTETIPLPYTERLVYQVGYQLLNTDNEPTGNMILWTYLQGDGVYPELDTVYELNKTNDSTYYPAIPFYENKTQIGDPANAGTPLYDQSKKLVEMLGFDYKDIVTQLEDGTAESIGKDKGLYAYLILGIQPTSGILPDYATATTAEKIAHWDINQPALNYLMEFFFRESLKADFYKKDFEAYLVPGKTRILGPSKNYISISDLHYSALWSYYYIDITNHTGVIGEIDYCTSEVDPDSILVYHSSFLGDGSVHEYNTTNLIYKRQINSNTYTQITVCGLQQQVFVFDNTQASTFVDDAFKPEDPLIMVVPLDRDIVINMPIKYKNRIIHASMHFIFNSYQIQEIEWYQQAFWSFAFTAIAIFLAVPTGGTSLKLSALLTVAGLSAAAYALLLTYMRYIIAVKVTEEIAEEFGIEATFLLAIVTMAYGKLGTTEAFYGLPFASDVAAIGSSIWDASNKVLQEQAKELEYQYDQVNAEQQRLEKELDKARQLLNTDTDLDPWLFVNPTPNLLWGDTPDSFIAMHIQNPSATLQVIDSPSNYVDLMLTLPTIDDTVN